MAERRSTLNGQDVTIQDNGGVTNSGGYKVGDAHTNPATGVTTITDNSGKQHEHDDFWNRSRPQS